MGESIIQEDRGPAATASTLLPEMPQEAEERGLYEAGLRPGMPEERSRITMIISTACPSPKVRAAKT